MPAWCCCWPHLGPRGGRVVRVGGLAQVQHGVRKEAHGAATVGALLAQLGAVLGRVQPALVHSVGVGAGVAPANKGELRRSKQRRAGMLGGGLSLVHRREGFHNHLSFGYHRLLSAQLGVLPRKQHVA